MLTHIVCWKYKDGTSKETQEKHIELLRSLPDVIPEIRSLSAGSDVLGLDRSFDTGLVVVFSNIEDMNAYSVHPQHQAVIEFGKEITERAVSVDFES